MPLSLTCLCLQKTGGIGKKTPNLISSLGVAALAMLVLGVTLVPFAPMAQLAHSVFSALPNIWTKVVC